MFYLFAIPPDLLLCMRGGRIMETVKLSYDKVSKVVQIDCTKDELLAGYARYLYEYLGLDFGHVLTKFNDSDKLYDIFQRKVGEYEWQEA